MSTNIVFNGVTYAIPAEGDSGWGTVLSNYFIALASGTLSKSGGTFALLSEVDFGATYGAKLAYIKSQATNPSGTGIVRLGNNEAIGWRNAANTLDLSLKVNASDILQFNGANVVLAGAGLIVNADISPSAAIDYSKLNLTGLIVNADIGASAAIAYSKLALTGSIVNADIGASAAIAYSKLSLTGAIVNADIQASAAIAYSKLALTGSIVDSDISGSAAIALSKLAALATGKALQSNASTGAIEASSVTNTELGYLSGVSSAIQTQLNAKEGTLTAGTSGQYYRGDKTWQTLDRSAVGLSNVDNTSDATKNAATVTLTNKDIDGGTASNTSRITLPKAAKTTLDALTRKEGTILFDTTSGKPYYDDGTNLKVIGSGSGGATNFITNGDAETGTTGWATYADAAGTRPVDGTGGTANVTLTTSSTNPLVGTNSFIFTKDAADRQGQGASYDFTIDAAYKAKVLKIEADYIVNSGTFVAGSSTTDSDVIVYIYDVTNGVLIEPSSFKFLSNSTTISDKFSATFQTSATSTQYRLIFHVASTSTAAYALKLDNISVSPSQYVFGSPVVDLGEYTPVFTNLGTVTSQKFEQYKVGKKLKVKFRFIAASGGASVATVSLPPGLKVSSAGNEIVGAAWAQSTSSKDVFITAVNGESVIRFILNNGSGGPLTGSNFGSGIVDGWFEVDILGWSSSVQVSDGYDSRVVALNASGTNNTSFNTTPTAVQFITQSNQDTIGSYNQSTGVYTFKSAGFYDITSAVNTNSSIASNESVVVDIFKNNTTQLAAGFARNPTAGSAITPSPALVSKGDYFVAGDYIVIRAYASAGSITLSNSVYTYLSIVKSAGNPTISASETVAFHAAGTDSAGVTTTAAVVKYTTVEDNTHGAYSASTGVFTAPAAGRYNVAWRAYIVASVAVNERFVTRLRKNSGTYRSGNSAYGNANSIIMESGGTVNDVYLKAGETLDVTAELSTGSDSLETGTAAAFFTVIKVGL